MLQIKLPETIKNICIFNASHVTMELAGALLSAIRSVHNTPQNINIGTEINFEDETTLYLIICPAGWRDLTRHPKYFITYQLDVWYVLDRPGDQFFLGKSLYNWDYSKLNLNHSETQGYQFNQIYVPPGYTDILSTSDLINGTYLYTDEGKDIDILFLGWDKYTHRAAIRKDFELTPLKIWFISGLNLEQMKAAIRRAKICLNIHVSADWAEKYSLQTIRLNLLLSNQSCIVSEDIEDPEKQIYQDYIKFVPNSQLVVTCLTLLYDFNKRRDLAIKSYQWYRNKRRWSDLVDFNSLLPLSK
jgi:hypothetical protein